MARFQAGEPNGLAVQQLEVLVRTAIFKPANALVGWLLQQAADRIDARLPAQARRSAQGPGSHRGAGDFRPLPFRCAITIITPARARAIIQPMTRWDWKSATRRPWPS